MTHPNGLRSVAISPDGKHAYGTGYDGDSMAVFSRDQATGTLEFVQLLRDGWYDIEPDCLDGADSISISPDGNQVYVIGREANAVVVFSRDTSTGRLSFLQVLRDGQDGVDGLEYACSLTTSPDGNHVYLASAGDDAVTVFSRDWATGRLGVVQILRDGHDGVDGLENAHSLAASPDGKHIYVAGQLDDALAVFSRDLATGRLAFVDVHRDGWDGVDGLDGVQSVTVSPDGNHVLAVSIHDDAVVVFTRDVATGQLGFQQILRDDQDGVDGLNNPQSVTVSPDGSHVYVASDLDHTVAVFGRNEATGRLNFLEMLSNENGGKISISGAVSTIASPDGNHIYAASGTGDSIYVFGRDLVVGPYRLPLGIGEDVNGIDFGSYRKVTISGQTFADLNVDNSRTPGEPGLNGCTIELVDPADGTIIDTRVTAEVDLDGNGIIDPETESGLYSFDGLAPGNYEVREVVGEGYLQTYPSPPTYSPTLVSGDSVEALDFGNVEDASISGRMFVDINGNGTHDAGERGLDGWTIELVDPATGTVLDTRVTAGVDLDGDGLIDPETERGFYTFERLLPDSYEVREVLEPGWAQTLPNPSTYSITLAYGQDLAGQDFGNHGTAEIHGQKWHDLNGDRIHDADEPGFDGWTMELIDPADGSLLTTTVTASIDLDEDGTIDPRTEAGLYSFTGMPQGDYEIREVVQPGWTQSFPAEVTPYDVTQTQRDAHYGNVLSFDFVVDGMPTSDGTLKISANTDLSSSSEFLTLRAEGTDLGQIFKSGGLDGSWVTATVDLTSNQLTQWAEDGTIEFTVTPSFYVSSGYGNESVTLRLLYEDAPVPRPHAVSVALGEVVTGLDFGNYREGSMSGRKFEDIDGDGVRDPGEPGLDGWTVELVDPVTGEVIDTRVTSTVDLDENGTIDPETEAGLYSFDELVPGNYEVQEVMQPGWERTLPAIPPTGRLSFVQDGISAIIDPRSVAASPDGKHIYAASYNKDAVFVFSRDEGTGRLNFVEMIDDNLQTGVMGLQRARAVTVSPDGNHVYVAGAGVWWLVVFSRDAATGRLTFIEELDNEHYAGVGLYSVTVSSDGNHVYTVGGSTLTVFSRDQAVGELTFVHALRNGQDGVDGLSGANLVTVSPDDTHVYVAGSGSDAVVVFRRNDVTGQLEFVQALRDDENGVDGLDSVYAVTTSPDGKHVYTASRNDSAIAVFSRDMDTGRLDFLQVLRDDQDGVDGLNRAESVTVSPDGIHVYAAGYNDNAVAVFDRDKNTGELTFEQILRDGQNGVEGIGFVHSVIVSPDGNHVYTASSGEAALAVFSRDSAPGPYRVFLGSNEHLTSLDFGNYQRASVSGQIFEDLDGSGTHDASEQGLDGWTVELVDPVTGKVVDTQVTASIDLSGDGLIDPETESGVYAFEEIVPGDYEIRDVLPTGWVRTLPDSANYAVSLLSGQSLDGQDFGNFAPPSAIRGQKWRDINGNRTRDRGEPGLDGWTIELIDSTDGSVLATTVTASVDRRPQLPTWTTQPGHDR